MSDPEFSVDPRIDLPDGIELRPATPADYDGVVAFTRDTWEERSDYLPDVYHEWIERDAEDNGQLTLLADAGDAVAGLAQIVMLSPYEAWAQGMRVNPSFRGRGVGTAITEALFAWARERGAVVARNLVFSWNQAGLGQSRAIGFEPVTEFRWLHPEPEPVDAGVPEAVTDHVEAGWSYWTASETRTQLAGLAFDMDETWAMRELTRETLRRAAEETALFVVTDGGTRALAYRTRTVERENDDGEAETVAEYGVGAWADLDAAETLLEAIAVDATRCGATRTRVLIPETARTVSDGAYLRAEPSGQPEFVLAADLTGW